MAQESINQRRLTTDTRWMALVLEIEDPSVAGARRGDPLAWADLYERYHPLLHRYLQVVDPEALDDIDEMWARAARTLPGQPEGVEPLIWLLRSARDAKIIWPSPDETSDPTIRAIRSLEPLEMDVIALRVVAGLPEEDIAMVVGRPVSRVRAVCHRGLEKLVHQLEPV